MRMISEEVARLQGRIHLPDGREGLLRRHALLLFVSSASSSPRTPPAPLLARRSTPPKTHPASRSRSARGGRARHATRSSRRTRRSRGSSAARPAAPPPEVHSELYQAASCGDLEAVDRLLADGRPADSGVSKFATTPLMVATRHGHREVASTLLKAGASPTQRNSFGETATSLAAQDDGLRALFPGGSHTYAGKNVAKRPCVHCARIVGVGRDGNFCHACGSCQNCGLGVFCSAPRRDAAAADAPPGCFARGPPRAEKRLRLAE